MNSVFHPQDNTPQPDQIKCREAHTIEGLIPNLETWEYAAQFVDKICDCGRIRFEKEDCGCPGQPWKVVARENPNHA